jgi:hypothetical protein
MTENTCPLNCCGVQDCTLCLNPVTGEFEADLFEVEADDDYPPEDYLVGYNEYGECMGG